MRLRAKHKYGAVATEVDGIRFASKKEARRYGELKLLEKAGEIKSLELQPSLDLDVRGVTIGTYRADFAYYDRRGDGVVEDVKGFKTPLYKWKKRHVEAQYGITIVEV